MSTERLRRSTLVYGIRCLALLCCCGVTLVGLSCSQRSAGHSQYPVGIGPPSFETDVMQVYLRILESAVDFFEPLWRDADNGAPNAGFFDFRDYGNWAYDAYATIITIPGNGMVALAYAVLLTHTQAEAFGMGALPREAILSRAVQAIRWCCLTSAYTRTPFPYLPGTPWDFAQGEQWIRRIGRRADATGYLTLAALLLWDHLDADTKRLVREVAIGAAVRDLPPYAWDPVQGGNHDQVKKDLTATLAAAYMFPEHPDHSAFMATVEQAGVDLVSRPSDAQRADDVGGKPLSAYYRGWNLYDDFSSDHHGHAQLWYGVHDVFEPRLMVELFARFTGRTVPETYTYPGNNFDGVLGWAKKLFLDSGDLAHPHGAEYDSYYGGTPALAFAYGSTLLEDPQAAALEFLCAGLMDRHTQAVRQYDYHRSSWGVAALAYLAHAHLREAAPPVAPLSEALASLNGVAYYARQHALIHRTDEKWVSFSWGTSCRNRGGFAGFVVPQRLSPEVAVDGGWSEPLVYFHQNSLTGVVSVDGAPGASASSDTLFEEYDYNFEYDGTGFSTAGERVWDDTVSQKMAVFSFHDGPVVVFTRLVALDDAVFGFTGIPLYFYTRRGVTDEHVLTSPIGTGSLDSLIGKHDSMSWWCIDGRLGAVVFDGPAEVCISHMIQPEGEEYPPLPPGYNWARNSQYRDTAVILSTASLNPVAAAAGARLLELGMVLYPGAVKRDVEQAADRASIVDLPDHLSGVVLEGKTGMRDLAVVCWEDTPGTVDVLKFSFPEGAPVLRGAGIEGATSVRGSVSAVDVRLGRFSTIRATICTYIASKGDSTVSVSADRASGGFLLTPVSGTPLAVTIKHFGESDVYSLAVGREDGAASYAVRLQADAFGRLGYEIMLEGVTRVVIVPADNAVHD